MCVHNVLVRSCYHCRAYYHCIAYDIPSQPRFAVEIVFPHVSFEALVDLEEIRIVMRQLLFGLQVAVGCGSTAQIADPKPIHFGIRLFWA